ncbi:MAG: hypothetical protein R3C58_00320 [Parvularculaceae bacterium]
MHKGFTPALIAAALVFTGCSSTEHKKALAANPAPCPNVVVLNDAARFIQFDGGELAENVAYSGEVVDVSTTCRYFSDKPIEATVSIDVAFGKGPKGAEQEKIFNYFVAVTRTNTDVIDKKIFPVKVKFDDDRPVEAFRVDIDKIVIPRKDENTSGVNFEIVIGFEVTPQQAIFNRSGKSLKFPDVK